MKALDGRGIPTNELIMELLSQEYGWTPSQIRAERLSDVMSYLDIIEARNSLQKNKNV